MTAGPGSAGPARPQSGSRGGPGAAPGPCAAAALLPCAAAQVIPVLDASSMNRGSRAQPVSRHRDPGPVFSHFAPEMMEDALIQLATENEQRLSELPDEAGSFKETQIVGEALPPAPCGAGCKL